MANNNNNKTLNVPNKRFPEFIGEWKTCSLNDIATFMKDKINTTNLSIDDYVSTENMKSNFSGVDTAISVPESTNAVRYKKGDVLISNIRPYLKKVWAANRNGGCSADVFVFRAKKLSPSFLHYVMANDTFINYVMTGAKGVKMPRGDKQQILKYTLAVPMAEEQHKICHLMTLLDERISTQNKIIDKLQSLIKGIYSFVFKNNTYKECFLLGDIANLYQPQTIASTELNENGKYIVYGANGIIGRYDYYNHERPQIIITCRGNTCGTVNFTSDHCWITGNSMVINMEQFVSTVYQKYLLHYLNSLDYSSVISGSGQPQIVRESLKKVKVYLPSLLEQTEVANSIDKVLAKFSLEQRLLDGLVTQKRYLLQQMFI